MNVNLMQLRDILGEERLAIIIRSIIDRIPIIILAEDRNLANKLVNVFASLAPHRIRLVFRRDFISVEEYKKIQDEENADYNNERVTIEVPCEYSKYLNDEFGELKGWIIGLTKDVKEKINILNKHKTLVVNISGDENIELKLVNDNHKFDLSFEKKLLRKIFDETEFTLEKIRRVVNKKLNKTPLSNLFLKNILDFSQEKEKIAINIFRSEITRFVNAARRAFMLLSRIKLLKDIGINVTISEKTLQDAIQFKSAPVERITDFIKAEWGLDLISCINKGIISNLGDLVEGLWG